MGLFGRKIEPPPVEAGVEPFLLWLARDEFGCRDANMRSDLDRDLGIIGDDVDDFVAELSQRYGEWVFEWPWQRFVCLDEGVPITAPFVAIWEFLRLPWRDTAWPTKPVLERLTLAHIAFVLERGEWVDP